MEMTTTIKIQKDTRDKLIIFKVQNGMQNMDEVIISLLKQKEATKDDHKI